MTRPCDSGYLSRIDTTTLVLLLLTFALAFSWSWACYLRNTTQRDLNAALELIHERDVEIRKLHERLNASPKPEFDR